ncbi:MAG: ribosomal protein S18 acetylase RimI-like enzyme [Yoonia sp.]|jgi:ribosomal protein S18 acetylase RimI-like enzyme
MNYRAAIKNDACFLAPLIFSSAPVALAATFDISDELSSLNFLHSNLLNCDGQFGYGNHWVAVIDNQLAGCISTWHSGLPDSFHQATFNNLTNFYGIAHVFSVLQASQALQDCIPKPKKHELCIGHFAVLAKYQGQGVATNLLKFAQQKALVCGKSALCLDVESTNLQAIDFYLGRGFIQESESGLSQRMRTLGIGSHFHLSKKLV